MKPLDPRLLRHARATTAYLALCVGLGATSAALVVAQAGLLAHGVTDVFQHGAGPADLRTTVALLAAIIVGRAVSGWALQVAGQATAAAVKTQLRGRLLAHVARLGPGWLTTRRSGELAALGTRGLDALDAYFANYLPQLVLAGLVPLIVLARIAPADPVTTVTITLTLPLIPVFMVLVGWRTERANRRQFRLLARLSHHFLDVLAGLPTLKAYRRTAAQSATIRRVTSEYRRVTMRTLRMAFLSSLVLELVATLSVALVAVGIGLRLVSGQLDLATGLLVLILAPEAYAPLRQVGANYHASAEGLAAAREVFEVLDTPLPRTPPAPGESGHSGSGHSGSGHSGSGHSGSGSGYSGDAAPDPGRVPVRLDHLTITYPGRPEPAVAGFDLVVTPGETVALVGPSGCGKSTVLAALLGFVEPAAGRVLVGDTDLRTLMIDTWRRQIAWVPQRPWLFAGTVADNIRLGARGAEPAAVRRAARQAGAEEFIDALPDGFDTVLGDRGSGLSAGQRQRLALARAFLRDASLVLLDEPTANLDGETEAAVLDAVRRLARGRTVVLAAHRPALVALADRAVPLGPAGPAAERRTAAPAAAS